MKNMNIRNIVVAIDFSDYSKLVVDEGKLLAKKMKVPITFLHVIEDVSMYSSTYQLNKAMFIRETDEYARTKYNLNKKAKVAIRFGKPHERIIEFASKLESPLILVGHRGRNPVARLFIGSTAEKLSSNSPFPVWVHRGNKTVVPKRILVPFDFSKRTDRSVGQLNEFSKTLKSKMEMYHVMEEPFPVFDATSYATFYNEIKRADDEGMKEFKAKYPKLKTTHARGWVAESIQNKSKRFDVISIAPRTDKNLGYFGSVTTKLIRSGNKPILVLP